MNLLQSSIRTFTVNLFNRQKVEQVAKIILYEITRKKSEIQVIRPYSPNKSKEVIPKKNVINKHKKLKPNIRAKTGTAELNNNAIPQFKIIQVIEVFPFFGRIFLIIGSE